MFDFIQMAWPSACRASSIVDVLTSQHMACPAPRRNTLLILCFKSHKRVRWSIQSVSINTHARALPRVLRDQIRHRRWLTTCPTLQHQVAHLSEGSTREKKNKGSTNTVENYMWEGTSRALMEANCRTKLHRPPVSIAMTTSRCEYGTALCQKPMQTLCNEISDPPRWAAIVPTSHAVGAARDIFNSPSSTDALPQQTTTFPTGHTLLANGDVEQTAQRA